jgi:hypothetical protein
VNTAVRRDSSDAKACALLETHFIRERHRVCYRDDRILGGRAERTVGLRAVAPHPAADALSGDTIPNQIDDASAVAVRNDTWIRHAVAKGILPLLDVTGIDAGCRDTNSHFSRTGGGIGHDADPQHLAGWALLLVPSCAHIGVSGAYLLQGGTTLLLRA